MQRWSAVLVAAEASQQEKDVMRHSVAPSKKGLFPDAARMALALALVACACSAYAGGKPKMPGAENAALPGLEAEPLTSNDSPFVHAGGKDTVEPLSDTDVPRYLNSTAQTLALLRSPLDAYRVTSEFGWRIRPVIKVRNPRKQRKSHRRAKRKQSRRQFHMGVDMAAARGTPVRAALDGTIVSMGRSRSYGYYIRLLHENGVETAYAHLSRFQTQMEVGQALQTGDVIGYVGSTGRSTGPHVHYEVLVEGFPVDPRNRTSEKHLRMNDAS